ncbi:MAG: DUF3793 family protein [Lachnospiraceae bacterium]|nr:DUF3793 family protein [Lachnospiraceae bacterium]
MSEELVIEHCSPTLAGIKTGNMFTVRIEEGTDINSEIRGLNEILRKKGLRVILFKKTSTYALVYIYRPDYLKKDLSDPQASVILKKKGYDCSCPEFCIAQLVKHLKEDVTFPHEVGLFLGYPPSDVESFMKDPCKGVQCCGCWKAYSEPEKAKRIFNRFSRCTEIYREMNKKGKSLAQLAVITDKNVTG